MAYSPLLRAGGHGVGAALPEQADPHHRAVRAGRKRRHHGAHRRAGAGDALGQPVVVENRPGAAGMVGAQAMMSSPADGYTLMMGSNSSLAVAPNLYPSWPYDPIKESRRSPIWRSRLSSCGEAGAAGQSLADLVKLAKEKPGQLSMASGGNGSSNHLVGELFQMMTGLKFSHVPYKGTGAALVDLAGGRWTCCLTRRAPPCRTCAAARSAPWRSPRAAARARCRTRRRSPKPACAISRSIISPAWWARRHAADAVAKLHAAAVKALATPQVRERFASLGVQPVGDRPEQFGALIRETWRAGAG